MHPPSQAALCHSLTHSLTVLLHCAQSHQAGETVQAIAAKSRDEGIQGLLKAVTGESLVCCTVLTTKPSLTTLPPVNSSTPCPTGTGASHRSVHKPACALGSASTTAVVLQGHSL